MKKEFRVNKYIILTLEKGKTIIYVAFKKFIQCKSMLINIPYEENLNIVKTRSIDEMSEKSKKILNKEKKFNITPEQEFWGHCSNLQAWNENNYDTRLLHSNLAFPLLKRLTEIGDQNAKRVFQKEIMKRIESKYPPVLNYLLKESYLEFLSDDYINELLNDIEFIKLMDYETLSKIKSQGYKIRESLIREKLIVDQICQIPDKQEKEYWIKIHNIEKREKNIEKTK